MLVHISINYVKHLKQKIILEAFWNRLSWFVLVL